MKKLTITEWAEQNRVAPDREGEQVPLIKRTSVVDSPKSPLILSNIEPNWSHLRLLHLLSLLGVEVEDEEL